MSFFVFLTLCFAPLPAVAHVGGRIKLRKDAHTAESGVLHHLTHRLRAVHLLRAVGAQLEQDQCYFKCQNFN
jgi:hypothetical protein